MSKFQGPKLPSQEGLNVMPADHTVTWFIYTYIHIYCLPEFKGRFYDAVTKYTSIGTLTPLDCKLYILINPIL